MAGRIAGITIEIGGDTSKLTKALKGVDSQLKTTQSNLKDINKLLKMDPSNVELLTQKQKNLENAIQSTKDRLEQLKAAQSGVEQGSAEWDALQREIIATQQSLQNLEKEYRNFGSVTAQQIAATGQKMKELGNSIENAGRKLQPLSNAATGALGALGALAYKSITAADDLNTMAAQTGLSTDELQRFQYASDLVDVSLSDITGALGKMKKNMTGHADTWERLGISVTNADGSMRNVTDVFYESLTALSQIENETERDQVAMELFGKSADSLAGIIDDGGKGLQEYGDEAERLGLIMSGETLAALNETNDTLDKMKATMGASLAQLGATLATTFAPAIEKLAGFIGQLAEKLRNMKPETAETIVKILAVVAALGPLLTVGGKLISGVGTLLTLAPKIVTAVKLVGAILTPATLGITAVVAAVIALTVVIVKNWDEIKAFITKTVKAIKDTVTKAWDAIKTKCTQVWTSVKTTTSTIWDGIKTTLQNKWNAIKSAYESHGGGLQGVAAAAMEGIKQKFTLGFDLLNSVLGGKLDNLKSLVSSAVSSLKNAFNFNWKLPDIKLPHFRIEGGTWPYGLGGKGQMPRISIDWYRKAYDNAMMFTSPTVMATPSGMKGFGDGNGAEIVLGLNKLRELVGSTQGIVINVYGTQGMDVNQLADAVQRRLVALQKQREVAYA